MARTDSKTGKPHSASVAELKVFQSLNALNVYELNRFRKFIQSPYFNVNERLLRLFESWEPVLRKESEVIPTKEESWSTSTLDNTYNDLKFRKLCSDLLRLFEQFLSQEAFEANPLHRADYLLQAVYDKRLEPMYNSSVRTAKRLSEQNFLRPASYYYYQYSFQKWLYQLQGLEIDRSRAINVEEIAGNLDMFYLAEKLRYYCYVLLRKPIAAHEYDLLFLDEIIRHIESEGYEDMVPINFYYQVYLTQTEPEETRHYHRLRKLINESVLMLPEVEGKEIIDSAINYCIQRVNEGKPEFLREIHDLYREALENELIFINGKITPWTFRNVIVSGLRLGEFEWLHRFIENYKDRIEEKYRENAVSFNLANLHFYEKEYDKVISMLQEVEYEDPAYNLNSKAILIATYYELDEVEPLQSLLASFATYLNRSKNITDARKQHYLNLIKFVRALIRSQVASPEELARLREQVGNTSGVVNKEWLLEKIDELMA